MPKEKSSTVKPRKPKAAPKPKVEKVEAAPKPKNYTTAKWHAKDMFQCVRCPWSTLDESEMITHVAAHLAKERGDALQKLRRVDTGLVGPSGGKIVREEPIKEST